MEESGVVALSQKFSNRSWVLSLQVPNMSQRTLSDIRRVIFLSKMLLFSQNQAACIQTSPCTQNDLGGECKILTGNK